MKQKFEAKMDATLSRENEAKKAARDNAYREINNVSFKRNYKMLLGNFSVKPRQTADH